MNDLLSVLKPKGNSNKVKFTAKEVLQAVYLKKQGATREQIAQQVGHSKNSVTNLFHRLREASEKFTQQNDRDMTDVELVDHIRARWGKNSKSAESSTATDDQQSDQPTSEIEQAS
jgi:DNA-binding transcriptional regulator LsrR (DeoR family)